MILPCSCYYRQLDRIGRVLDGRWLIAGLEV